MTYQKPKLAISFSGGRTSAVMTKLLLDQYRDDYSEIEVVFCNTGQEHEATLEFVKDCDEHWAFNTVWLEAKINLERGKGVRHRVVDFKTASRKGEPFEAYIQKYGIPNRAMPQCTSRLKTDVMHSYRKKWGTNYLTAIGIRADEADRISANPAFVYPLVKLGYTKEMVNKVTKSWPFDLKIPSDAYGNCVWCWKKSLRKLLTVAKESPEYFDFPKRMEQMYSYVGHQKSRRVFFRGNMTAEEILWRSNSEYFKPYKDDEENPQCSWLDIGGGCGESCEIGADN